MEISRFWRACIRTQIRTQCNKNIQCSISFIHKTVHLNSMFSPHVSKTLFATARQQYAIVCAGERPVFSSCCKQKWARKAALVLSSSVGKLNLVLRNSRSRPQVSANDAAKNV